MSEGSIAYRLKRRKFTSRGCTAIPITSSCMLRSGEDYRT